MYNISDAKMPDWYNSSLPLKVVIHGFAGRLVDSTQAVVKGKVDYHYLHDISKCLIKKIILMYT